MACLSSLSPKLALETFAFHRVPLLQTPRYRHTGSQAGRTLESLNASDTSPSRELRQRKTGIYFKITRGERGDPWWLSRLGFWPLTCGTGLILAPGTSKYLERSQKKIFFKDLKWRRDLLNYVVLPSLRDSRVLITMADQAQRTTVRFKLFIRCSEEKGFPPNPV